MAKADFEWNGDPARGLNDARIPVNALMNISNPGQFIPILDLYPEKGDINNALYDRVCEKMQPNQAFR